MLVTQWVRVSAPGLCCAEGHRLEPRSTRDFLSGPCTLYCLIPLSLLLFSTQASGPCTWQNKKRKASLLYNKCYQKPKSASIGRPDKGQNRVEKNDGVDLAKV